MGVASPVLLGKIIQAFVGEVEEKSATSRRTEGAAALLGPSGLVAPEPLAGVKAAASTLITK
jgi:hypothetical protein